MKPHLLLAVIPMAANLLKVSRAGVLHGQESLRARSVPRDAPE